MTAETVVSVHEVTKRFGEVLAVNSLSFDVSAGEIFGVVGPNGAGKTTTIEMVEGLCRPDSGRVTVFGTDPRTERTAVYRDVGVLLQEGSLPKRIRVGEAVSLYAGFYPDPRPVSAVLADCGVEERSRSLFDTLSGGEKRRVLLAIALVGRPRLLILDEPTSGMDPQGRYNVWQLLRGLRQDGMSIVVTTHYLEEAEDHCDRIGLIDRGEVVALGRPRELLDERGMRVSVQVPVMNGAEDLSRRMTDIPGVRQADVTSNILKAFGDGEGVADSVREAAGSAVDWNRAEIRPARLEDLFLQLTGHAYR